MNMKAKIPKTEFVKLDNPVYLYFHGLDTTANANQKKKKKRTGGKNYKHGGHFTAILKAFIRDL